MLTYNAVTTHHTLSTHHILITHLTLVTHLTLITQLKVHIICGCELPRASPSEQCPLPEVYDRYCPASKFQHKVPANKQASVTSPYCTVEVHGGGAFSCAVAEGEIFHTGNTCSTQPVDKDGLRPR